MTVSLTTRREVEEENEERKRSKATRTPQQRNLVQTALPLSVEGRRQNEVNALGTQKQRGKVRWKEKEIGESV
jgi:hypothetical protein